MCSRSMLHAQNIERDLQDSLSLACGRGVQREVSFRCCAISNPALKQSDRRITCTEATASSAKFAIDCAAALYSNNMTSSRGAGQLGSVEECLPALSMLSMLYCRAAKVAGRGSHAITLPLLETFLAA